jgi:hypothetical protein
VTLARSTLPTGASSVLGVWRMRTCSAWPRQQVGDKLIIDMEVCQQLNVCCGWHGQSLICSVVLCFAHAVPLQL